MPNHIVHGWLSFCAEFPGINWVFDIRPLEYMLAFNVHPPLDALSEKNVEKTSACANATHVKMCHNVMVEFDKASTSPTTKLWLTYMNMVMILNRYTHAERTCLRAEHLTEVENIMPYLVVAGRCKYVSCLSTT